MAATSSWTCTQNDVVVSKLCTHAPREEEGEEGGMKKNEKSLQRVAERVKRYRCNIALLHRGDIHPKDLAARLIVAALTYRGLQYCAWQIA